MQPQTSFLDAALIGWPKTGSSSLFNWLGSHPEVAPSTPKETFFFMDREHPLRGQHGLAVGDAGLDAYSATFFAGADPGAVRIDGSVHAFYQETALTAFSGPGGPSLVIAVLRSSPARIMSSFTYTRENLSGIASRLSFAEYVDALLAGDVASLRGSFRRETHYHVAASELVLSDYGRWLHRWETAVGRSRLAVVGFGDLVSHPSDVVKDLCARLGIDSSPYDGYAFPRRNETVRIRSHQLHRLARRVGSALPRRRVPDAVRRAYIFAQSRGPATSGGGSARDAEALRQLHDHFDPLDKAVADRYGVTL